MTTLESLKAQLKSVMDDLSTTARHQAGTPWHADRVREAEWLFARIDAIRGIRTEGGIAPLPR